MSGFEQKVSTPTVFTFEHPVFTLKNGCFRLAHDDEPVFVFKLDDKEASVAVRSLSKEFGIDPNGPDGSTLKLVVSGLRYVKIIRPGDSIPQELLDGTASWTVTDDHMETARARLTMQLVSWMTGGEMVITDAEQLQQVAKDPNTIRRVREAFRLVSDRLAFGDGEDGVHERVERIARELCYVEALREKLKVVKLVKAGLDQSAQIYRRDKTLKEELARMLALIQKPLMEIDQRLDEISAQTGEILPMMRNIDKSINYIRDMRDDLHNLVMMWDDIAKRWAEQEIAPGDDLIALLRLTYQFLARRYTSTSDWRQKRRKPPQVQVGMDALMRDAQQSGS